MTTAAPWTPQQDGPSDPLVPPPPHPAPPAPPASQPSRRGFFKLGLAVVAAAAADATIAGLARPRPTGTARILGNGTVIDFVGSGGDADDSALFETALQRFQAAADGATLRLHGKIRIARRGGFGPDGVPGAALFVSGGNDKTVEFDTSDDTQLIVDNLKNGLGSSHGIAWLGAGRGNALLNPDVTWATAPDKRSTGDGIRIVGFPSDSKPPSGWTYTTGLMSEFRLENWSVENTPGAGAILMGVSDPLVTNGSVTSSHADGLHFNACRRPVVQGHTSTDAGDDGLAFVTYYGTDLTKPKYGPFNQPTLGEFSNTGAKASKVTVKGGRANGVRVSGVDGITLDEISVTDKGTAGVMVDSAIINSQYHWTYLASRGVQLQNSSITDCSAGVMVSAQNVHASDQNEFYDFQVTVSDTSMSGIDSDNEWILSAPSDLLSDLAKAVDFPSGANVARRTIN